MRRIGVFRQFIIVMVFLLILPFIMVTLPLIYQFREVLISNASDKQRSEIQIKIDNIKDQLESIRLRSKVAIQDAKLQKAFEANGESEAAAALKVFSSSLSLVSSAEILDLNNKLILSTGAGGRSLSADELKQNPFFLGTDEIGVRLAEKIDTGVKETRALLIGIPIEIDKKKVGHLVSVVKLDDLHKEFSLNKDESYSIEILATQGRMNIEAADLRKTQHEQDLVYNILWMGFEDKFLPIYVDQPSSYIYKDFNNSLAKVLGTAMVIMFALVVFMIFYIKKIRFNLGELISGLARGSLNLGNSGVDLVQISSESLASTSNLKDNISKTATAIEEMKDLVDRTTELTAESAATSLQCDGFVKEGKSILENMHSIMGGIETQNDEVKKQLEVVNIDLAELSTAIKEVSEKTNVINEIVFQTRILSFNASVEAARAGDQGKGFSVVAQEVGSLAAMSGTAAVQITQMIIENVQRVGKIVKSVDERIKQISHDSTEKVKAGLDVSSRISHSFDQLQDSFGEIQSKLKEIKVASAEQSNAILSIRTAMNESKTATQSGELVAQRAAEQSQKIKEQVNNLKSIAHSMDKTLIG